VRITIQAIATHLQLSPATVSRVLNRREDAFISQTTRQRVLRAAAEMGYRPNRAARALVTGRTDLITLALNRVRSSYYTEVIYQLQEQLRRDGYETLVGQMAGERDTGLDALGLSEWPTDGIIIVDPLSDLRPLARGSLLQQTPFVCIGTVPIEVADYVVVDLDSGAREAVEHLISLGCRRIGYFAGKGVCHPGDARYDAYSRTIQEAGLQPEIIAVAPATRSHARAALCDYVRDRGCPDGLFCFHDDLALAAYRALCDLGLRVPEEVALVGCDGIQETQYLEKPLTTIVQPLESMCALAWQYLQRRMQDPAAPLQQTILTPCLEIRPSSRR